jgi:hypothetical protein
LDNAIDAHDLYGDIPGLMQPWFDAEHEDLYGHPGAKGDGVLMGCPVWGMDYIDRFAAYTIPTLMAPANLAALKDRCRLVIYHERDAKPYLHRLTAWVRRGGIEVIFRPIPDDVMGMLARGDYSSRFRTLGVVGNVLTHMAGRAGMGFHMLQPDHLYGVRYFENLLRLGKEHDAVTQMSLNATLDGVGPEIEKYRTESGALAIPDRDLGDMAYRHMHPQCQLHSMNAAKWPDKLPCSHRLWWQGKDAVHVYSSHVNAAWLSPGLCLDSPIAFTSTMDTLLPEYVPGDFYVPTVEDEMTFIEFSDAEKPANRPYVAFKDFAMNFWGSSSFTGEYMPYFSRPSLVPIKPKASFLTDEEIKRQFGQIVEGLNATQDSVGLAWMRQKYSSRFARAAALPEVMR